MYEVAEDLRKDDLDPSERLALVDQLHADVSERNRDEGFETPRSWALSEGEVSHEEGDDDDFSGKD